MPTAPTTLRITPEIRQAIRDFVTHETHRLSDLHPEDLREHAAHLADMAWIDDAANGDSIDLDLLQRHHDAIRDMETQTIETIGYETIGRRLRLEGDEDFSFGGSLEQDLAKYDEQIAQNVAEGAGYRRIVLALHEARSNA